MRFGISRRDVRGAAVESSRASTLRGALPHTPARSLAGDRVRGRPTVFVVGLSLAGALALTLAAAALELDPARSTDARLTVPFQSPGSPPSTPDPARTAPLSDRALLDRYCL